MVANKIKTGYNMKNKMLNGMGKRLKNVREALGMSGKDFAHSINTSQAYLSQIERGNKNNPGVSVFYKVADKYNVSLDYLIKGSGDMFIRDSPQSSGIHRQYVDKIESLDDLYWLLENSTFFRNVIMGIAFKLHYENEALIKSSLVKNKNQNDEKEHFNEIVNKQSEEKGEGMPHSRE
jgi:transcriptional regulator with XRE-family HTH domain